MITELITPPAFEPVTLLQAKQQCRVFSNDEDDLLTGVIIPGARDQCEQLLRRSIMLTTWRATLDYFPGARGPIRLRWPNLQSIVSIEYRNGAGQWVAMGGASYEAVTGLAAEVRPIAGVAWPATSAEGGGNVRVTYKAGYSGAAGAGAEAAQQAAVPPSLRHWLLLRIATAYRNRGELVEGVTVADLPGRWADSLLDRERVWGHR